MSFALNSQPFEGEIVYDPPGHLPTAAEIARTLTAGDGYTAEVGRRLLYDEPASTWQAGLTVANCTLYARQRVKAGDEPHFVELPCVSLATDAGTGLRRLGFDLAAAVGLLAGANFRVGHYDASIVAALDGGPVTLLTEIWAVSPTPKA